MNTQNIPAHVVAIQNRFQPKTIILHNKPVDFIGKIPVYRGTDVNILKSATSKNYPSACIPGSTRRAWAKTGQTRYPEGWPWQK